MKRQLNSSCRSKPYSDEKFLDNWINVKGEESAIWYCRSWMHANKTGTWRTIMNTGTKMNDFMLDPIYSETVRVISIMWHRLPDLPP